MFRHIIVATALLAAPAALAADSYYPGYALAALEVCTGNPVDGIPTIRIVPRDPAKLGEVEAASKADRMGALGRAVFDQSFGADPESACKAAAMLAPRLIVRAKR